MTTSQSPVPSDRRARHDWLRKRLDEKSQQAASGWNWARTQRELAWALRKYLPFLTVVLAVFVILQFTGRIFQTESLRLALWPWLAVGLAVWLWAVLAHTAKALRSSLHADEALSLWDHQLQLRDRLRNASVFLRRSERTIFMDAAIEDAVRHLPVTDESRLKHPKASFQWHRRERLWSVAAGGFMVLGLILGVWEVLADRPVAESEQVAQSHTVSTQEMRPEQENQSQSMPEETSLHEPTKPLQQQSSKSKTHAYSLEIEDEAKESEGKTGSGRSSAAESSSGASKARGVPSQQGQISKPGKKKDGPDRKSEKKKEAKAIPQDSPNKDGQESGATAGRGSSRGSNRNPAVSEWSSKDHVNEPDDSDLEEEDEIEDEDEEQESRGGMQPSLRDRKPPTSRDLSIGFGNRPNPDANGRGGPSEQKKSRGTASLVLGVPIPDRVKGQPNPGKTKITQERVEPRSEPLEALPADQRPPREDPLTAPRRQELQPWMRAMVRNYFLSLRNTQSTQSP